MESKEIRVQGINSIVVMGVGVDHGMHSLQIQRIANQMNEEIKKAMIATPIVGRDPHESIIINSQFKVESLENSLRFLPYRKEDALIWELIGIVDSRMKLPRKLKKRLTIDQKNQRTFDIKLARIRGIQKQLPENSNFAWLCGKETIRLGVKYLMPVK
jgi:hypothetical protein